MSFKPKRDISYFARRPNGIMETENYVHETIMYLISILESEKNATMELTQLTVELCKRGNTKPLKKLASGDSVEERVLAFAWQHPSIFDTNERNISLKPMKPNIDEEIECNLEERLIQFLTFRCNQYGPCQIPISKLLGNLHQAASDIKFHFHNDYSQFYNFLRTRSDIFTLIDSETVALKTVHDQAIEKNKSLLKCDEYFLDERVLNCTRMVNTFNEGIQIVQEILNTKDIVAIDCEGVNLGAPHGSITLVQLAIVDELPENHTDEDIVKAMKIFLFDVQKDENLMFIALKKLLKSSKITKIFQGCSSDATALYTRYKIITESVFDTVIAHRHLNEGAKSDLYYLYEFYVGEGTNRMKKDIKKKYISYPYLWTKRPLDEHLTYYAAFDVFALIRIYYKLKSQIDQKTYNEIFEKSSAVAQSAYRRNLPAEGVHLYAQGLSMAQVHAQLGWELDSDDEATLGIVRSKHYNNFKPRPKQYPVNGKSYHRPPNQGRNSRSRDITSDGNGSDTHYPPRNTKTNHDHNNYNTGFYLGPALYRTPYNSNHRQNLNHNHNHQGKNDHTHRPMLPQNNSNYPHQQIQTRYHNNNTTQRTYYQQQFKYPQQPYQFHPPNFQYQQQYQPDLQYQQQYQLQQHQYQQNQYQQQYQQPGNQQQSTQIPHHQHHPEQQQQTYYQPRNNQFNSRRNKQN